MSCKKKGQEKHMINRPTIKQVNLLLLVVILLQASNVFFAWMPTYIRLILNQFFFILLPALIYLRRAGLPVGETVKWRWPGAKIALFSLFIGTGFYPLAAYIAHIFQTVFDYQLPEIPGMIPTNHLEAVLALIALAIMAPICEEILFRGVAQNAYAHHGPARSIIFVGLLFVAFHLSLLQGLSIIPLALALGFVYWRTNSLPAAILTHFGANFMAVLVLTGAVWIGAAQTVLLSLPVAIGGLFLALASLWMLTRATVPDPQPGSPPVAESRLKRYLPLLAAFPVFVAFIGAEIFVTRFPELVTQPVALNPLPWQEPQTWHYEISNILDEPIGEATCSLTPDADAVTLVCEQAQQGYEIQQGNSYWYSIDFHGTRTIRWQRETYAPISDISDHTMRTLVWTLANNAITVETTYPEMETRIVREPLPLLAQDALVTAQGVWPWQLAALSFEAGATSRLIHLSPDVWRPASNDNGPVLETMLVKISGPDEIKTPSGTRNAWKVEVGKRETAWYDAENPNLLLRYFNGMETWTLVEER
jgi:membrane protease YdiL (CAAX protease family)